MKTRYSIYNIICCIISAVVLSSCIEKFEDDLEQQQSNMVVVEGTIVSDSTNTFYLTRSLKLKEDTTKFNKNYYVRPVTGAKVSVIGNDGSEYPLKTYIKYYGSIDYHDTSTHEDEYVGYIPKLNPEVEYYLRIIDNGDIYETTPAKPISTPDIDTIDIHQADDYADVDILLTTKKMNNSDDPAYYESTVDETWEVRPVYTVNVYYDPYSKTIQKGNPFYRVGWRFGNLNGTPALTSTVNYESKTLQKCKLYSINSDDERVRFNYSGLINQRAISKEEYEYKLACKQASSEMGGLFSPQASTIPSNIHCINGSKQAIGFVGVSMNTYKKRFYIDGEKISLPEIVYPNPTIVEPTYFDIMYKSGNRLLEEGSIANPGFKWVARKYVDISIYETVFEKPSYMPWKYDKIKIE